MTDKEKDQELERLKQDSGAGVFGAIAATLHRGKMRIAPKFVRRGYVEGIIDDLNAFYAARPRPWRPANRSSCKPTHKERLKMRRQAATRWRYSERTDGTFMIFDEAKDFTQEDWDKLGGSRA